MSCTDDKHNIKKGLFREKNGIQWKDGKKAVRNTELYVLFSAQQANCLYIRQERNVVKQLPHLGGKVKWYMSAHDSNIAAYKQLPFDHFSFFKDIVLHLILSPTHNNKLLNTSMDHKLWLKKIYNTKLMIRKKNKFINCNYYCERILYFLCKSSKYCSLNVNLWEWVV